MTELGIVFALGYLVSLRWGRRGVATVMVIAAPYWDSAFANIGELAISPYYAGAVLLAAMSIVTSWLRPHVFAVRPLLLLLFSYVVLVTAIAPTVFAGVEVISAQQSLDVQFQQPSQLLYSASLVAQVGYLALNLLFVSAQEGTPLINQRAIEWSLVVGISVSFAGWVAYQFGLAWPSSFFENSVRNFYTEETGRVRGQFSEPSHLGVFALLVLFYFVVSLQTSKRGWLAMVRIMAAAMAGVCLFASASTTGLVGVFAAAAILSVILAVRTLRAGGKIPVAVGLVVAATLPLVALVPTLLAYLAEVADEKLDGQSAAIRSYADERALGVFLETGGFGAGLGANRASSLFLMMLSTVGWIGVLLILVFLWKAVVRGLSSSPTVPVAAALVAYITAASISMADFANPVLWSLVAVANSAAVLGKRLLPRYDDASSVHTSALAERE